MPSQPNSLRVDSSLAHDAPSLRYSTAVPARPSKATDDSVTRARSQPCTLHLPMAFGGTAVLWSAS